MLPSSFEDSNRGEHAWMLLRQPRGKLPQMWNAVGSQLAGIIDSCQPVIPCAKMGLGPQMAAGSQVPAHGCPPHNHLQGPTPEQDALAQGRDGA